MKTRSLSRGFVLAVVAGAIAAPTASGAEPGWEQLAATPEPRQEVSYAALGGKIYLAAGNALEQDRYDPATDSWAPVADLPAGFAGLDHVNGVAVDGRIVYAGGLDKWEYPFPVNGEVALYDPGSDSFASGTDMPGPRAAGGAAAWHGKLIYAGGLGPEGSVARVDVYDPETGAWTRLRDMPRPRDHFQAVVVGDELYAVGGRRTVGNEGRIEVEDLTKVDELELPADDGDLAAAEWRPAVTSIPTDRGGLGVAAVGECIYAIGGERAAGPDEVTGAVESYDTASGEWRELPPLPVPRHGIQAATVGQTIYVAGGGTVPFDYVPTDAHEALEASDTAPCVAVESETGSEEETEEPGSDPGPEPEVGAGQPGQPVAKAFPPTGEDDEPRIAHLAVLPRRVVLSRTRPVRRRARIVVWLTEPGRVTLSLPGELRFSRPLHRGRNTLPLPVGPHHRLLPRGPYRLIATPRTRSGEGRSMETRFEVIR
jgi:hypothetical protein